MKKEVKPQEFFVAGGTLWSEAPSYITRPVDEELLQLTLAGEYCNILAARQMGKSSLMVRTAIHLQKAGVRTAIIDISTLGGGISTPGEWFFGFLDELSVQLDLDVVINDWWESHAAQNAVQRFSNFLRDVVLAEIATPITIFIDEIDSALGMAFTGDFFAAIRAAYNARASTPDFHRLTFVLIGVARPADLIRDRNRTPYNIGAYINLRDFTLPELRPFQEVFEKAYPGHGAEIFQNVLEWTNGQPYLTQKLCAALLPHPPTPLLPYSPTRDYIAETVHRLFFTDEARKESNLRAIRDRIESSPHKIKMLQVYEQILRGKPVLDEERSPAKNELKLTGVVRPTPYGQLEIRNRIYRKVFDRQWVRKNLPQSLTRQIAILTSLLAIVAFISAGYALYQQRVQSIRTFEDQFNASGSPDVKLTSLARLLGLNEDARIRALELYSNLSQEEKRDLFTTLSNPQNVAPELVTVIEAVYQENDDTPEGNQLLNDMRQVLGRIGASGAPSLKTEIEFWLKGREEAGTRQNYATAVSFYDSAWAESETRNHPNFNIRFDRAMALIALEQYPPALEDLQAVWEQTPARQGEVAAVINAVPALAYYIHHNSTQYSAQIAYITPVPPTATPQPSPTPTLIPIQRPTLLPASSTPEGSSLTSPTATQDPSPYTGWIAYVYGESTAREIYIMNPATGFQRQITSNGVIDEAPSFSPDNWRIVYASNRSQGGWELYTYDLQKGTEQQLTSFDGQVRFPAWSPVPGDTRIVFEGRQFLPDEVINIWMLDAATGDLDQLTNSGADSRPGWSPDGTQVVFGRATMDTNGSGRITAADNQDVYTLNLASRTEQNLTNTPLSDDFGFSWSPDGAWIAFTSVRGDANGDGVQNLTDSINLFMIPAAGGEERQLELGSNASQPGDPTFERTLFSPSWSPDGRTILVVAIFEEGQNEIWAFNPELGTVNSLTDRGPYFQPAYAHAVSSPSINELMPALNWQP